MWGLYLQYGWVCVGWQSCWHTSLSYVYGDALSAMKQVSADPVSAWVGDTALDFYVCIVVRPPHSGKYVKGSARARARHAIRKVGETGPGTGFEEIAFPACVYI
jgi:hypothetical protein